VILFCKSLQGPFYVHPDNWHPFMPHGFSGVMSGVSAVFFAYIGFDAISTTAEECKNPQRDLPRAMFNTLIICTILYIILTLVLTGMTSFNISMWPTRWRLYSDPAFPRHGLDAGLYL